ncbi:hypothetical protein F3Y22_tig00111095pilonHSYRG00177 [Hibiscus syriacus]|uniref:NADP-dependent oxidoreductase domain-containing protein n=1 Tax=Hibiscus syriacus TaxID=106335 RepID=A0A6A2Z3E8_HIBSY|nr:hypothetical protein F3Y22_tig00111095pilonHSYRG00177 [Hibiscus syriacus]
MLWAVFFLFVVACSVGAVDGFILQSFNVGGCLQVWLRLRRGIVAVEESAVAAENLASRSLVDVVLKKVNGMKPISDELGVPLAQLAIAWCAANPNVSSVITGATKES